MSDKIRHSGKLADTWLNRCEKRFNFRPIKISRNISRLEIAISNQDKIWNPSYSVEIGSRDRKSRPESNMEPFWYLTGPEIDKFKQNLWNKHPKIYIGPNFRPTWTGPDWSRDRFGNIFHELPKCDSNMTTILINFRQFWKNFPSIIKKWLKIVMIDQFLSHFLIILGNFFQND